MDDASDIDRKLGLVASAVASDAGHLEAYGAAVLGLVRALGHIPQVGESVEREVLRIEGRLLATNLNTQLQDQFDLSAELIRATLKDAREKPLGAQKGS